MTEGLEKRSEQVSFGGRLGFYSHASRATQTPMNFGVYLPPQAEHRPAPALYYLAGLTCNEETFLIKGGALRVAAEVGLALVACDTSPRGLNLPGESEHWDFGLAAGFYVDATRAPWNANYRMGSYVNVELPEIVEANFPVSPQKRGIFGHSMGGHGALVSALRHPDRWQSVSAFAPITNPMKVPWGQKAFSNYLGAEQSRWAQYDACELMKVRPYPGKILVDQGAADQFLDQELKPENLELAAKSAKQDLTLRVHPGYDHSYWFIQSFMADHLLHHASRLL